VPAQGLDSMLPSQPDFESMLPLYACTEPREHVALPAWPREHAALACLHGALRACRPRIRLWLLLLPLLHMLVPLAGRNTCAVLALRPACRLLPLLVLRAQLPVAWSGQPPTIAPARLTSLPRSGAFRPASPCTLLWRALPHLTLRPALAHFTPPHLAPCSGALYPTSPCTLLWRALPHLTLRPALAHFTPPHLAPCSGALYPTSPCALLWRALPHLTLHPALARFTLQAGTLTAGRTQAWTHTHSKAQRMHKKVRAQAAAHEASSRLLLNPHALSTPLNAPFVKAPRI